LLGQREAAEPSFPVAPGRLKSGTGKPNFDLATSRRIDGSRPKRARTPLS
jgi:hypothetical protein